MNSFKIFSALKLPAESNNQFFVQTELDDSGMFTVGGSSVADTFTNLKLTSGGDGSLHCLAGTLGSATVINLTPVGCDSIQAVVCRKIIVPEVDCSTQPVFVKKDTFDLLLDPKLKNEKKIAVQRSKDGFMETLSRLDKTKSFTSVVSNLWYATLPCFDVKGVTSEKNGEYSVLKYCQWKGKPVSCSAIFTTFPTDRGMCCSFNMKAADQIFKGTEFPQLVKSLQNSDKNLSFTDSTLPKYYVDNKEPKTLPGRIKGLLLILDAHSNMFSSGSVDSDFEGFTGYIGGNASFPLLSQGGFEIRPGHNNLVALSASKIDAEEELRGLSEEDRKCRFPDENSNMTLYKEYSYTNCIFECSLLYARNKLQRDNNVSYGCIPWYFPSSSDSISFCDPWETLTFLDIMVTDVPDEACAHCIPDCIATIYEHTLSTVPFRRCDSSNLGISYFCDLNQKVKLQPSKFAKQVVDEYTAKEDSPPLPSFVTSLQSGIRTFPADVFSQSQENYDAFDRDIAVVEIYFEKPTIFQMGSQPRMTWVDYLSNVGGLLGLVLGMGIVSFIELIWLCMRLLARKYHYTHIVP